jgi:predicted Zn-dependent protease
MQQARIDLVKKLFKQTMPAVDFASIRYHSDRDNQVAVRQGVLEPLRTVQDEGVMVTVHHRGGVGYAATSELTEAGVRAAFERAVAWAERLGKSAVTNFSRIDMPHHRGEFKSPVRKPWESMTLKAKVDLLSDACSRLKRGSEIVDWAAELWHMRTDRLYLTNGGGEIFQCFDRMVPSLVVTANRGPESVTRTFGRMALCRQQGFEILIESGFNTASERIADEALELLAAPNCPEGKMDLLLAPDQMVLQIHESIGHPLELDRILGDERNYAGTSFVTMDMFGKYQYGSPLLNVTFDPSRPEQAASYAFDDEGRPAERQFIIKDGILLRPLGATVSETRADYDGVASARADSWRRPAIDRMSNLNVEPGKEFFDDMVDSIENGIYMQTNCSWSIDDSRNKFQFGCERAQLIENGKLTKVVKKPNYRGISASFWRSLKAVGNGSTLEVLGTPNCGKGEPNQAITVGHASPPCLFANVDVFGGE